MPLIEESHQIILVIAFAIKLIFLVLLLRKREKITLIFSLAVSGLLLWTICVFLYPLFENPKTLYVIGIVAYWGPVIASSSILLFSFLFPTPIKPLKVHHKVIIMGGTMLAIIMTLIPGFVLKGVTTEGYKLITGVGLYPLFFIIGFFLVWALINLIKKYFTLGGIYKLQLKYLFLGIFLTFIISFTSNAILAAFNIYEYIWLGPVVTVIFVIFTTYTIVKHRFMDIRLVLGRGAVYIFSFTVVIGLGLLLSYLNVSMGMPVSMSLAGPIMLVIGILLFPLLFRFYEKFAARYFYYTFYSYQKVLTELGKKLTGILDLRKLSNLIANTLINTMKLTKVGILLREAKTETYGIHKIIGFRKENGLALIKDDFLTLFLEKTKKPLIYEELSLTIEEIGKKGERKNLIKLQENMERLEAEACLPLLFENKIIGIIVLGKKISGEPYSTQDIELLINLSNQSAIAFQNARFYREVEDLSKNLEKRVKAQVRQIESLSKMKSEFLKVVNHQLRTPVSIVKGMLSMMEEGSVKGKKLKEFIKKAYISSERLSTILDDILTAQDLMAGERRLAISPCNIKEIVESQVKHFKLIAKQKKLKLILEKSRDIFPLTLANPPMIERIVSRVIDNAILYTDKGQIKVSLDLKKSKDKRFIQISVKDSGLGLTKKDKKKLFKLFHRGEEAISLHPNGSGLGLFIVKNLVELHKGTIKVKSEGRNKGTTFIIRLPVSTEI